MIPFIIFVSVAAIIGVSLLSYWLLLMEKWFRIVPVKTECIEKNGKKRYYVYFQHLMYGERDIAEGYDGKATITEKTYNELVIGERYRALFKGQKKIILARLIDTT